MKSINCQSCGAPLNVDNHINKVICPYCHTEMLLSSQETNTSSPEITVKVMQESAPGGGDDIDKLERLHRLFEKGVLSEEEFLREKEELLNDGETYFSVRSERILVHNEAARVTKKPKWVTYILCLYFGCFGAHRFYTGHIWLGFLYLFSYGLFGIGWLVDLIRILTGKYTDKNGYGLGNEIEKPKWVSTFTIMFVVIIIIVILQGLYRTGLELSQQAG